MLLETTSTRGGSLTVVGGTKLGVGTLHPFVESRAEFWAAIS
ncbi:MAG: hypothetical protein FWJ74_11970 [Gemmatimonadota bacterium]|jgi:hypothetical protein